jgi:hypothetical protein
MKRAMTMLRRTGPTVLGLAGALLVTGSARAAFPIFPNEINKFVGVPVATEENYIQAGGVSVPFGAGSSTLGGAYVSPREFFSGGALGTISGPTGRVSGTTESIRGTAAAAAGINLAQPMNVVGVAGDIRAGTVNPLIPIPGTSWFGQRVYSLAQIQSIQDGVSVPLLPLGDITAQLFNMTPKAYLSISGPLVDDGTAPNSIAGDGIPDFTPFIPVGAGKIAVFTVDFFGAEDGIASLTPRIDFIDDSAAGTLLDTSGAGHSFPTPVGPADNDLDGKRLVETYINHNAGGQTGGSPATEVAPDATDVPAVALTGTVSNAQATFVFRQATAGADVFLDLSFQGDINYDGGSLYPLLAPKDGTVGATITGINWSNYVAATPGGGVIGGGDPLPGGTGDQFDYAGAQSASFDASFSPGIPEPMTGSLALMGLAGLAAVMRRRSRA